MGNERIDQTQSSTVYDYPEQKRRYVVASVYPEKGMPLTEILLRLIISELSNRPDSYVPFGNRIHHVRQGQNRRRGEL